MTLKRSFWPAIAAAALLCVAMADGCKKKADASADEEAAVTVQAEKVAVGSITETVEADTVLVPQAQAQIVPKISAPVKRFLVQRGSRVRAGQVLAVLENADLAAAVTDTRGSLTQAQANLSTTVKATVPEDTTTAQTAVDQAKANLDVQREQTASRQNLLQQGAIPKRDYETARAALVQAEATYAVAAEHLAGLQRASRAGTIQTAEGGVTSARGKYEQAQASLSYASVRSPIPGVVTDRPLYAGEMAQAGTPLLTVMDTSVLLAKVHLPQEKVAALHVGDKASATVNGLDGEPKEGAISLISPALDAGSTTVEVWVKLANRDGALKPGAPVHVAIETRTLENIPTVPAESVIANKSGGTAVMVVGTDGLAHERDVKLGISDGKDTQVIEGVHPGEMVVTTGAKSLEDKTKVEVGPAEGDDAKPGEKTDDAAGDAKPAAGEADDAAKPAAAGKSTGGARSGSAATGPAAKSSAAPAGGGER